MTTSDVKVTPGTGRNVATYSIVEDAETKELQRIVESDSSGNEIEAIVVGQGSSAQSLPVVLATDDPLVTVTGTTVGAAVITDAAGTLQQYLRGIVKLLATGATTILGAGSAIIGKVGIDRSFPGTTNTVAVISGQDGVAGGAGAVGATVQRMTLASDDPAVASLSVLDDWDETDRAKVNIIAGQAGVAGNAGAASALTVRTVTASDSPEVATLGATSGAKVITDANGTLQQYLRGLVSQGVNFCAGEYETVAASATDQTLGATGATGDYLEAVLIVPGTSAAGAVSIKDGSGSAISIFAGGGTTALADLAPIYVPLGMVSTGGAWKVTTGSNVTAIGIGNFT